MNEPTPQIVAGRAPTTLNVSSHLSRNGHTSRSRSHATGHRIPSASTVWGGGRGDEGEDGMTTLRIPRPRLIQRAYSHRLRELALATVIIAATVASFARPASAFLCSHAEWCDVTKPQCQCEGIGSVCGAGETDLCGNAISASCGTCGAGSCCRFISPEFSCLIDEASCPTNYQCGSFTTTCGNTLDCGTCGPGSTCQNHQCVACTPTVTCASTGATCGSVFDSTCNTQQFCGTCPQGQFCTVAQTCQPLPVVPATPHRALPLVAILLGALGVAFASRRTFRS
jgi:hypothetical protein